MKPATLYLIPTVLGDTDPGDVLPRKTLELIRSLTVFIVEEMRTARRFLRAAGYEKAFDKTEFLVFNEHTRQSELQTIISPMLHGKDSGLLSEAGTPCIADPGSYVVDHARKAGIRIVPLTGPSSIFLALMASGFNGQHFAFHGYLPIEREERMKVIRKLEKEVFEKNITQIFIETPYRNNTIFNAILQTCKPVTKLCIAINLTSISETIHVHSIAEWRSMKTVLPKQPAVYLLYR